MSGTRGIGRRRGTRGKTVLADGIPEGATVNTEPAYTPTQVIEAVPPAQQLLQNVTMAFTEPVSPALAQEIREALDATERGETEDLGSFEQYADEPVPDLDSPDPADRTEWFRLNGGSEPLFEAVVADLEAAYLLDTSLPVPVRTAPEAAEDTTDSGPGTPPAGEAAVPAAAAPPVPGPVSTEDEPVQDEPAAEADCAEGSEA